MDETTPAPADPACATSDVSFAGKVGIFSHDYLKCCLYIGEMDPAEVHFSQKFYSTLASGSTLLEDFLDYHGAKNNKNWYFYRELTAAMRHIALASNFQKHIANRLRFYDLPDSSDFQKDGESALLFLKQCLQKMAPVVLGEARRLDI